MSTNSKLLLLVCCAAFTAGIATLWCLPLRTAYTGNSSVRVSPYTNAIFSRSFESAIRQGNQGVKRLFVFPVFSVGPTLTSPGQKSGAVIGIITRGTNALEAQRFADEAAVTVCASVRQCYGVTAVIGRANQAKPYSFYHDTFIPESVRFLPGH